MQDAQMARRELASGDDGRAREVLAMMAMKSWRASSWLIAGWTLVFAVLALADAGASGSLTFFLTSSAPVSLWTWAIGAEALGLFWYATRPGTSRVRVAVAALAALVIAAGLLSYRQTIVDAPPLASAVPGLLAWDSVDWEPQREPRAREARAWS